MTMRLHLRDVHEGEIVSGVHGYVDRNGGGCPTYAESVGYSTRVISEKHGGCLVIDSRIVNEPIQKLSGIVPDFEAEMTDYGGHAQRRRCICCRATGSVRW